MTVRDLPRSRGTTKYFAVITIFMKYSLSGEVTSRPVPQTNARLSWKKNIHYLVHKRTSRPGPSTKLRSMPFI